MATPALATDLALGLAALGLVEQVDTQQQAQLLDYISLLQKWNKTYNLTAITAPHEVLVKHIFDCLAIVPFIQQALVNAPQRSVLDVGSGAGLPAVVLAICLPDAQITALDLVHKKMAFVQFAASQLKLGNLTARAQRIEACTAQYALITSRAWTQIESMLPLVDKNLLPGGQVAAMKGPKLATELKSLDANWQLSAQHPLVVPMLNQERHLCFFEKKVNCST